MYALESLRLAGRNGLRQRPQWHVQDHRRRAASPRLGALGGIVTGDVSVTRLSMGRTHSGAERSGTTVTDPLIGEV